MEETSELTSLLNHLPQDFHLEEFLLENSTNKYLLDLQQERHRTISYECWAEGNDGKFNYFWIKREGLSSKTPSFNWKPGSWGLYECICKQVSGKKFSIYKLHRHTVRYHRKANKKNPHSSNNGHSNITKTQVMNQNSKSKLHLFFDVKFLKCLSTQARFYHSKLGRQKLPTCTNREVQCY